MCCFFVRNHATLYCSKFQLVAVGGRVVCHVFHNLSALYHEKCRFHFIYGIDHYKGYVIRKRS